MPGLAPGRWETSLGSRLARHPPALAGSRGPLSPELQVRPEAHPVGQLPAAGGQRLGRSLQPLLFRLHGLALPVWLQHGRGHPEHRDPE